MWEFDHKEGWLPKNWCFWTVVLEKTLVSPLDCKEIQPVHPKGNQSWIFTARIDAEAEAPILWPPDVKSWLFEKAPDAGKDWGQEETGLQRMRRLDGITDSMDMNLSKFREIVEDRGARNATVHGAGKSRTRLSDWTTKRIGWVTYSPSKQLLSTSYHGSYVIPWNAEREIHCVTLELRLGTGSRSKKQVIQDPYTTAGAQDHVGLYLLALSIPFTEGCGCLLPELRTWGVSQWRYPRWRPWWDECR